MTWTVGFRPIPVRRLQAPGPVNHRTGTGALVHGRNRGAVGPDPRSDGVLDMPIGRRTSIFALLPSSEFFYGRSWNPVDVLRPFLKQSLALSLLRAGSSYSAQGAGAPCGAVTPGQMADRFGRRFNALGFVAPAVLIALFLALPAGLPSLCGVSFLSGAALCSSVIWGPWFAELYPFHLRSTTASIFNWGRVIGFFAPLLTARVAERHAIGGGDVLRLRQLRRGGPAVAAAARNAASGPVRRPGFERRRARFNRARLNRVSRAPSSAVPRCP